MAEGDITPAETEDPLTDPRVREAVACIRDFVVHGNTDQEVAFKAIVRTIASSDDRSRLITELCLALAETFSGYPRSGIPHIEVIVIHLEEEISFQDSRARDAAELKNGLLNYLIAGPLGVAIAVGAAPLWMSAAGPLAPLVSLFFFCVAVASACLRYMSFLKERDTEKVVDGLETLKRTLERRL